MLSERDIHTQTLCIEYVFTTAIHCREYKGIAFIRYSFYSTHSSLLLFMMALPQPQHHEIFIPVRVMSIARSTQTSPQRPLATPNRIVYKQMYLRASNAWISAQIYVSSLTATPDDHRRQWQRAGQREALLFPPSKSGQLLPCNSDHTEGAKEWWPLSSHN